MKSVTVRKLPDLYLTSDCGYNGRILVYIDYVFMLMFEAVPFCKFTGCEVNISLMSVTPLFAAQQRGVTH